MAAGDDQKNVYLWKLSKNLPKLVRLIIIILFFYRFWMDTPLVCQSWHFVPARNIYSPGPWGVLYTCGTWPSVPRWSKCKVTWLERRACITISGARIYCWQAPRILRSRYGTCARRSVHSRLKSTQGRSTLSHCRLTQDGQLVVLMMDHLKYGTLHLAKCYRTFLSQDKQ